METRIANTGYEVLKKSTRNRRAILYHVVIAEKILGRPLSRGECVHHANENKLDNRNSNLVICPSHAYHMLLHQRINAKKASGNPNYRPCTYCKEYDDPSNLKINKNNVYHLSCANEYNKIMYRRKNQ